MVACWQFAVQAHDVDFSVRATAPDTGKLEVVPPRRYRDTDTDGSGGGAARRRGGALRRRHRRRWRG